MTGDISIEDTNKIRKSLGLPLLPIPGGGPTFKEASDSDSDEKGSTLETRQAQAYENYRRIEDERKAKAARESRNQAVRKARNLAARDEKLAGTGLGEADDQEQDTRTWLIGQKKRLKKVEKEREKQRRLAAELEARENVAYTSKDLAGVRVAHELGDFDAENEQVLVLKDTTIDENEEEGDELENVDLREQENRNERLRLKKRKPVYNPNEDNNEEGGHILKQYDETIEEKKRKRFTLDNDGGTVEEKQSAKRTLGDQAKRQLVNLDVIKDLSQSDYAEPKEIKIKKSKKQKAKSTRKKLRDEDEISSLAGSASAAGLNSLSMETDQAPLVQNSRKSNSSLIDDEDLQASLSRQRREALKKRKRIRPEDLAQEIRNEEANGMKDGSNSDEDGIIIDETSFFVSNIDERQREIEEEKISLIQRQENTATNPVRVKKEEAEDSDASMTEEMSREGNTIESEGMDLGREGSTTVSLGDEADFNRGLGSVFNFLKGRGMLDAAETSSSNEKTRQSQIFRSEKRRMEVESETKARAQRLAGRETGRYAGHSQREREEMHRKENEHRQQQDSMRLARLYNNSYVPSFQLTYKDEFGREMTQKEAFKHMSHQFHGKGSGKMKTEKHLKKIEDEKKNESRSLMDNSQMSNYSNAADATAKKRGTVGVQLGK